MPDGRADGHRAVRAAFSMAAGMAFLAGAVDVCGLARLQNRFVSFMSGNTTTMGAALGVADLVRAGPIAALVALFVVGAAGGAALAERSGRRHATVVTLLVAALLVIPVLHPGATAVAFVLAMGALNAALDRVGAASVSLTYVTGTLVRFGQGLGGWLAGRRDGTGWLIYGPVWLSFLAGAAAGAAMQARLGRQTVWPLPVLALVLAGATVVLPRPPVR